MKYFKYSALGITKRTNLRWLDHICIMHVLPMSCTITSLRNGRQYVWQMFFCNHPGLFNIRLNDRVFTCVTDIFLCGVDKRLYIDTNAIVYHSIDYSKATTSIKYYKCQQRSKCFHSQKYSRNHPLCYQRHVGLHWQELRWRHMSILATQITDISTFVQRLVHATNKDMESPHHWDFVSRIHRWPTVSLH